MPYFWSAPGLLAVLACIYAGWLYERRERRDPSLPRRFAGWKKVNTCLALASLFPPITIVVVLLVMLVLGGSLDATHAVLAASLYIIYLASPWILARLIPMAAQPGHSSR